MHRICYILFDVILRTCRRRFDHKRLAQIMAVLPEAYKLEYVSTIVYSPLQDRDGELGFSRILLIINN